MTLILFADILGSAASMLATILFVHLHKKAWIVSCVAIVINLILYGYEGLYADTGLEIFYLLTTIYGLIAWSDKNLEFTQQAIFTLSYRNKLITIAATLLIYLVLTKLLYSYENETIKNLDALTTALSLVAQYLMCKRYIETWILWFITDSLYVFMYHQKFLVYHEILMLIYVILAVAGYLRWHNHATRASILQYN